MDNCGTQKEQSYNFTDNIAGPMIKELLESYHPKNHRQAEQALREIMQEIALPYSALNFSPGLAIVAFTPLKLTVATAITTAMTPARANIHHVRAI